MKLEAHGIRRHRAAGQPRPFDRVLALLDPVLRRAALVVKRDNPLGRTAQVGDDEADAGIKLARMSFHFGDDPPLFVS